MARLDLPKKKLTYNMAVEWDAPQAALPLVPYPSPPR